MINLISGCLPVMSLCMHPGGKISDVAASIDVDGRSSAAYMRRGLQQCLSLSCSYSVAIVCTAVFSSLQLSCHAGRL